MSLLKLKIPPKILIILFYFNHLNYFYLINLFDF